MALAAEPGLSPKCLDSISESVPSEHRTRGRRGTGGTVLPLAPSYSGPISLWADAATSLHSSGEVLFTGKR